MRVWIGSQPGVTVEERELRFQHTAVPPLHFHIPSGEGQLLYFVRLLASLHHEEATFVGGLLWTSEWGVWAEWTEDIGHRAVSMLRGEKAATADFGQKPGQLFGADEFLEAVVFLLLPILAGWDAYYCPTFEGQPVDYIVKISHEAWVDVVPSTAEVRKRIHEAFSQTAFREADCRKKT